MEDSMGRFLKKLGIKPPYDPAIPLLVIYPAAAAAAAKSLQSGKNDHHQNVYK